ncbi:EcsC protein family protein [Pseudoruegeria aquimaris]|uniref:EcsC protein family protein n=1 Tax=Pseudoruegeria aquimaris TaxID=393663 RepID=A0A1Y5TAE2_9RHOB|nr:EcsC family protein [Pseudoruegeria aquimaris]SLN59572.1 EcsC protein family protein [Pseudoruegeria aquimaris]
MTEKLPRTPDGALPEAIRRAFDEQRAYEEARATRLGRGAEKLTAPLGGLIGKAVPASTVRAGLDLADRAAGLTVPASLYGHDTDDIAACDEAALKVQAWSQGVNAASGGAAGFFGMAGMTADIPATLSLAARNVRATGVCYGFDGNSEEDRLFRLMVLEAATAQAGDKRRETLDNLNALARHLNSPEGRYILEKGGDWVVDKVVERVARALGVSLAGRKAAQVVPLVGGVVAATVNASFQADVSRAARYAYRQRWFMARKLLSGDPT